MSGRDATAAAGRLVAGRLAALEPLGMRLDLGPFRALLDALGHPERGLPAVLVAGTNGKGSTAALLASIGAAAGLRTGLYTSPHLARWEERIRVDGAAIDSARLLAHLDAVLAAADAAGLGPPTPFEATTAAAFRELADAAVDLAVLEVGLGGRLDATNAAEPILAVVTRIGLDHRAELGDTLAAIAREKAGVLRPGVPAVVAAQPPAADAALAEAGRRRGARLHRVAAEVAISQVEWRGLDGHGLRLDTPERRYDLELALAGEHQLDNAAAAVRAAELLAGRLPAIDGDAVARGVAAARWPGRLESLARAGAPPLLVDAAHNPDGCAALASFLARLGEPYVLLFGALADKETEAMLPPLAAGAAAVVLTRPPSPRAAEPAALAACVPAGVPCEVVAAPEAALAAADRLVAARGARRVVGCGSIYLVGALRELAGASG